MQPSPEENITDADLLQNILNNPDFDLLTKNAESYLTDQKQNTDSQPPVPQTLISPPAEEKSLLERLSGRFSGKKGISRRTFLGAAGLAGLGLATGASFIQPTQANENSEGSVESAKTPEKPINLTEELLKPLTDEVRKRREEMLKTDPEYAIRVDSELNKKRGINFLVVGSGSEMSYGEEDADAIVAVSYSQSDNTLGLVSIHRDTQAPEVFQEAQKKGITPQLQWYETEVMRAIRVGGIPLLEKVVESTTGLAISSDYYIELKREALPDFIDKVFGKIKINVPQDIPKDTYGMGPFTKGEQEMDGKRVLEYFTTRSSTTMERRNSAQQQVMELMLNEVVNRFTNGSTLDRLGMLKNIKDTLNQLQKEKKISSNIPIDSVLNNAITKLPGLLAQAAASKVSGNALLQRPMVKRVVFGENAELKRYDPKTSGPRGAIMSYVNPDTKAQNVFDNLKIAATNTKGLVSDYYKYPRQIVKQILG